MERRRCPATDQYLLAWMIEITKGHQPTVAIKPADDDRHGGVDTGDSQKEATVLNPVVVHVAEEDRESSQGDEQGEDDEEEAVFGEIGEGGNDHGEDEGDSPWWDGEELSPDRAVAEGPDDSRGEVGVGVGRDDESEVHETTSNDTVWHCDGSALGVTERGQQLRRTILENVAHVLEGVLGSETGVTDIILQTGLDESLLFFSQPGHGLREISDEPPHSKTNDTGEETLCDVRVSTV